jgi:hypothetical protein
VGWVPWPERDDEWERIPPERTDAAPELTVDWTPPETVAVFYDANGDVLIELTDEPVVGFARWLDDD